jgi:hypothetical protein
LLTSNRISRRDKEKGYPKDTTDYLRRELGNARSETLATAVLIPIAGLFDFGVADERSS